MQLDEGEIKEENGFATWLDQWIWTWEEETR